MALPLPHYVKKYRARIRTKGDRDSLSDVLASEIAALWTVCDGYAVYIQKLEDRVARLERVVRVPAGH